MTRTAELSKAELAQHIADDLIAHLDEWYSLPETFDNALDRQIHEWYANAPRVFPKRPYFSPSAASACPRELYYKLKREPRDVIRRQPHQGRWQEIGTSVGDMIQRTILAIERNFEEKTGKSPRFRFERNEDGTPMFEEFAKKNHPVKFAGHTFYLYGTCDGIMEYSLDGEKFRVGLEIKSKQTTPAKTSEYSMRGPEEKHVQQCACYAEMYDVDMYVILYVNTAHKSWNMTEEDYEKNPDIRAFGVAITDEMKAEIFDYFTDVLESVDRGEPLPLDLDKWAFNGFKQVIAQELTREELEEIRKEVFRIQNSSLPEFKKRGARLALAEIEKLREAEY